MDAFIEFDASGDKQLAQMVSAAESFVTAIHLEDSPNWLTFLGSSGAGKTMLAQCILRWAKANQFDFIDKRRTTSGHIYRKDGGMLKWSTCCDRMLNGDYGWMYQAKNDWLVILDDIGVEYEKIRALAASKLYEILEARRGRWTVITANLSAKEISDKLDSRIASRLFRDNSIVLDVDVKDYNIKKFEAKQRKALK